MKKIRFIFMVLAFLSACGSDNIIESPEPSIEPVTITFSGLPEDEDKLSEALLQKSEQVGVLLGKGINPDNEMLLDELNKWITAVKESGGKVHYEPWHSLQGIIPINLVVFSLQVPKLAEQKWYKDYQANKPKYDLAKKYDARLCYRRDDNLVTKIVFVERLKSDKQACRY